jgi:hypothetical protein
MSRPLHETIRRVGQVILVTTLAGIGGYYLAALIVLHLGMGGFIAAALAAGVGLITIANVLKRREKLARKDWI